MAQGDKSVSFLFAKTKTTIPEFTGLQIQTAVNVLPIPLIYGCPRSPMNIIYANGFHAVKNKRGGKGKGLLTGGKGQASGYTYYATFIGALAEGQITTIIAIFDNQQVYTLNTVPQGKIYTFFNGGTNNTAPWSYLTTNYPADAFAYKNTVYVGCPNYPLDSSATIPQLNFILQGKFAGTSPLNLYTAPDNSTYLLDADPAQVIYDFLTNSSYGVGFPATYIDTTTLNTSANGTNPAIGDAAVSTYCQAVGLAWSVALNNAEPAASILDRWCRNLVVAPVWTGNTLRFIPYYDVATSANPGFNAPSGLPLKYYTPNNPVRFNLDDRFFIQTPAGEDPVTINRIDVADVKNVVRLDYRDRGVLWNDNVSEAKDETSVELYGPRVDRLGTADEFTHGNYAGTSVQQQLQRNIAIRNIFEFKLGWQFCVLDPMDVVTLTDSTLGLNQLPVRIRSIEEDEKGILTIVAEEFPLGAVNIVPFARQNNLPPTFATTNVAAPSVNTPAIFEPTVQMLQATGNSSPAIVIGASGGPSGVYSTAWGGANIFISNDNITYVQIGQITGPSRQGVTTATLPAFSGANPDNTNTLAVSLVESNSTLETVTAAQAAAGITLCAVVDPNGSYELLAYQTATLTGPNAYNITGLYRGLYGTIACSHASGAQFLRVDSLVFETQLPTAFIGTQVYLKLQSFNLYGLMPQDLSTVTAYTYTPIGAGTNVSSNPDLQLLLVGTGFDCGDISTAAINSGLDLNSGGPVGGCAPQQPYNIDCGTLP